MRQTDEFLDGFFWPNSLAIVGATNNHLKMNFRIVENLVTLKFKGRIYPVNMHAHNILGIKAFSRLRDIKETIDVVISAVPASNTMDIVKECNSIGVKRLVIITGGFSEGGDEGKRLAQEIASFVKENNIRTLGPNTLSPINTGNNLVISFNPVKKLKSGGLSFAFQSGFYEPKLNWIFAHLGINKMIDMGNKMDINEVDALRYFLKDPSTKVIGMHIESLHGSGKEFFNLLRSTTRKKPVIILKSGHTNAGSQAAASHTGSIANENDLIFDSLIRQAGAIRAQNIDQFFDFAKAFEFLPLPKGNKAAIIMLSGGEGVMATDSCQLSGLEIAKLNSNTHQKLKQILPPWEIPLNPFDAGVCMEFHLSELKEFFSSLSSIPKDENVDATIMQMPPDILYFLSSNPETSAQTKKYLHDQYITSILHMRVRGKPFVMWCSTMDEEEMTLVRILESSSLPVFQSSERAINALSAMHTYNRYKSEIINTAKNDYA
jgi:acetate---CoA ligase (ADP-forming)